MAATDRPAATSACAVHILTQSGAVVVGALSASDAAIDGPEDGMRCTSCIA